MIKLRKFYCFCKAVVHNDFYSDSSRLYYIIICTVVHQDYQADVYHEYVIKGNAAIFKCNVPSFVADFVSVQAWQSDAGDVFSRSSQFNPGN